MCALYTTFSFVHVCKIHIHLCRESELGSVQGYLYSIKCIASVRKKSVSGSEFVYVSVVCFAVEKLGICLILQLFLCQIDCPYWEFCLSQGCRMMSCV